jgi:hypothetical protein
MQTGFSHLGKYLVLLKPDPEHREVIDLFDLTDVEAAHTGVQINASEIPDKLALTRGRSSDEDDDIKSTRHAMSLINTDESTRFMGYGDLYSVTTR